MAQLLTALNFGEMGALKSAEISDFLHVKNNNISDVTAEKKNKQKFKKKIRNPAYQSMVRGSLFNSPTSRSDVHILWWSVYKMPTPKKRRGLVQRKRKRTEYSNEMRNPIEPIATTSRSQVVDRIYDMSKYGHDFFIYLIYF